MSRTRSAAGSALRLKILSQEGVTVLKQMLEMEAWQRVPIPLQVSFHYAGVGSN